MFPATSGRKFLDDLHPFDDIGQDVQRFLLLAAALRSSLILLGEHTLQPAEQITVCILQRLYRLVVAASCAGNMG